MTVHDGFSFTVRPLTEANRSEFEALFESRGAPHYCWCTIYRLSGRTHVDNAEKKEVMRRLIGQNVPVGVLAYDGDKLVGWCSVAPRETHQRLERSRTMPRVTPPETPTWTILCFFVLRVYRGRGVSRALLGGALDYARSQGARIVEAYPYDTAGHSSSTHRGHSSLFRNFGFRQDGARWFLDFGA